LNDVVSKTQNKYTLLHFIAHVVEEHFPSLLFFPDELAHVKDARQAIESMQVNMSFMRKDFSLLQQELNACKEEGNATYSKYLSGNVDRIGKDLQELTELDETFKQDVTYFGERSGDDIATFFSDWDKFTQSFQVAVKYNITLRKKDEALKRKDAALQKREELKRKKEQRNQKKLKRGAKKDDKPNDDKSLKVTKDKPDGDKKRATSIPGSTPNSRSREELLALASKKDDLQTFVHKTRGVPPKDKFNDDSAHRGRVKIDKKTSMLLNDQVAYKNKKPGDIAVHALDVTVDTMLDDVLQAANLPKRDRTDRELSVKQLVSALRTSQRFTKIRASRSEAATNAVSVEMESRLVKQVSTRLPKFTQ